MDIWLNTIAVTCIPASMYGCTLVLRNPLPCTLKENNAKIMSLEAQLLDERAREQQGKKEQTEQIKALKLEIKAHKEKADRLSLFFFFICTSCICYEALVAIFRCKKDLNRKEHELETRLGQFQADM